MSSPFSLLGFSCVCLLADLSSAYLPTRPNSRLPSSLNVFGPETIGIAVISAAAGAATQQPKIQQLEGELTKAKLSLEASKEKMVKKIEELENKLFEMDREYEGQTAKFQKEYDEKKKVEIERVTDKIKTDYKFKLEVEVEKEKGRLLSQKLEEESERVEQLNKLAEMRMQKEELELVKSKLQLALSNSEDELERLQGSMAKKNVGFWPF